MIQQLLAFVRKRLPGGAGNAPAQKKAANTGQRQQTSPEQAAGRSAAGENASKKVQRRRRRKPGSRKPKQRPSPDSTWSCEQFIVPPVPGKIRFHDVDLPDPLMHAIADLKFEYCTPIQEKALPAVVQGRDIVGKANTGTGKSAVFLIGILTRLLRETASTKGNRNRRRLPQALVIAPTRELVIQIAKDGQALGRYTDIGIQAVYGGAQYQQQMDALRRQQCDIVVATPGRLLDFVGKRVVCLDQCAILVIDEADRMLDMGFIPDVRRIIGRIPAKEQRQTMLFSATITPDVQRLASQWCRKPVSAKVDEEEVAAAAVEQIVYLVTGQEKYHLLYNLLQQQAENRVLVFANQKHEARKLNDRLRRNGIDCALLTGDVPQNKRTGRLESFRAGRIKVLVATDVAGRGIHIDNISHVVNYTLPYEPEDYVHRIGRTGRAGASGTAISFACEEGGFYLPAIEEFIEQKLECIMPDPALLKEAPKGTAAEQNSEKQQRRRPSGKRRRRKRQHRRRSQDNSG